MTVNDLDSFEFSRNGFLPHVKSPIIWGNIKSGAFPLCYLTKPKSLSDDEWNNFLDHFTFSISKDVENDRL